MVENAELKCCCLREYPKFFVCHGDCLTVNGFNHKYHPVGLHDLFAVKVGAINKAVRWNRRRHLRRGRK